MVDSLVSMGAVTSTRLDKANQDVEVKNPIDGVTRRWHIQSNMNASPEVRRHEVVWSSEDLFDDKKESDLRAQGQGIGRGFVSALACGDRVGVVARARVCFNLISPTSCISVRFPVIFVAERCVWCPSGDFLFRLMGRMDKKLRAFAMWQVNNHKISQHQSITLSRMVN
jgi:hypothetical protein